NRASRAPADRRWAARPSKSRARKGSCPASLPGRRRIFRTGTGGRRRPWSSNAPGPGSRDWLSRSSRRLRCYRRPGWALLEDLVELLLDPGSLFFDLRVIDWHRLHVAELRAVRRRVDVDACGIAAVLREQLLRRLAQHEVGERLGRVRMRGAFDDRRRRGDDERPVRRVERLDLMSLLARGRRVAVEGAERDRTLAALDRVEHLLVALHDHDVVRA